MLSSRAKIAGAMIIPAGDRPACWWALLVGAPPTV